MIEDIYRQMLPIELPINGATGRVEFRDGRCPVVRVHSIDRCNTIWM